MYYEETDKKADQKTYKMITKLLHEYEGELHKEEIDYITNFTFTESYFYVQNLDLRSSANNLKILDRPL
jgi:hypothetical protein